MNSTRRCKNCSFYQKTISAQDTATVQCDEQGECRFNPPTQRDLRDPNPWPAVRARDWCREHRWNTT